MFFSTIFVDTSFLLDRFKNGIVLYLKDEIVHYGCYSIESKALCDF